ncbi:nucleotide sugar dehydrogenase [Enterococcus villorum]|uniref:nucleotide sugar dehydrogenase n=1 Tax=Enterococcus villorum TaxID=112904 RepID=UPI003F889203
MTEKLKIGVIGLGYVGLANTLLLGQENQVIAYDLDKEKIKLLKSGKSPIEDTEIQDYLAEKNEHIQFTQDFSEAIEGSHLVLIATPTNYDEETNVFDTSSIESSIAKAIQINRKAIFLIKSTIPIGYTEHLRKKLAYEQIIFSPEFLREGRALYDNLYPSRIIVGDQTFLGEKIAELFKKSIKQQDVPIVYMEAKEAEAVKLFANTYLAMRIAYFNELDTYAEIHGLNTEKLIRGIGLDPRIGDYYNNPSFGYGGYCLPKDSKQLEANFEHIPNRIIHAIVEANEVRKEFITNQIMKKQSKVIGIYKLAMKKGSDNYRQSAIQTIISLLKDNGKEVIIYEPSFSADSFDGCPVMQDFIEFEKNSELIVANRMDSILQPIAEKVYTRDLFNRD